MTSAVKNAVRWPMSVWVPQSPPMLQRPRGLHPNCRPLLLTGQLRLVLENADAGPVKVVQAVIAGALDIALDDVRLGSVVDGHPDNIVDEHLQRLDIVRTRLVDRLRVSD